MKVGFSASVFRHPVVFLRPFLGSISVAALLCASVTSDVTFVLSLFVPHLSFFWCQGMAVPRDCDIS